MNTVTKHSRGIVYALFFASGFCGLVYEVIWVRMLGLIMGNSVYAVSLVLAAFMTGLGIGSFAAGRFAENKESPLKIYGYIEIGIGAFAVFSPSILNSLNPVYAWMAFEVTSSTVVLNGMRLVMAFAVLVVPTILMGATFPVLSKYFVRKSAEMGADVGALYGINTAGATAGCLATGFVLVQVLGVREAVFAAALINLLIGATIISFGKYLSTDRLVSSVPQKTKSATPASEAKSYPPHVLTLVFWAFGLSGFAAIAYEVIWTRALGFFAGHTSYAFTSMLATFLFGIGMGSLLISGFSDRIRNLVVALATVELLIGISSMLSMPLLGKLFFSLEEAIGKRTWATPIWVKFCYCFVVMFLPTLLMGMTFPLASKIYVNIKKVGRGLGNVYSINTLGGILGSLLAGFLFMPLLGVQRSIALTAILNVMLSAVLVISSLEIGPRTKSFVLSLAGAGLVLIVAASLTNKPTYSVINRIKDGKSIYYSEGLTNTVEVVERESGVRDLYIDGELNASTSRTGVLVHQLLAELPLALHDNPTSLFLVGLGSGMTAAAALPFGNVREIGCAEISTDIVKSLGYFRGWNHDILTSDRFHLQIEDGRVALFRDRRKYDVIVTGIIHPKYNPGNAGLYSQDYYELCKGRLADGGLMCQWVPLNALRESEFKMIIRTFQGVFPHASLWFEELYGGDGNYNAVLVGSNHELSIEFSRLSRSNGQMLGAYDTVGASVGDAYDFLDRFMQGEQGLREYAGSGPVITDDRPRLEFGTVVASDYPKILSELGREKELVFPFLVDLPASETDRAYIRQELERRQDVTQACIAGDAYRWQGNLQKVLAQYRLAAQIMPENGRVRQELDKLENIAWEVGRRQYRGPATDSGEGGQAADASAMFRLGMSYQKAGKIDSAIEQYSLALHGRRDYPEARNNLGIAYMQKGLYEKAEAEFETILKVHPTYVQALANLGMVYARTGRRDLAIGTLEKAQAIDPGGKVVQNYLSQIKRSYQEHK